MLLCGEPTLGESVRLCRMRTSSLCVAEDGCFCLFSAVFGNCELMFVLMLRDCACGVLFIFDDPWRCCEFCC